MTAIKCKMCGGDLHITEGSTIAECEYCGTKQTIPTIDNEKKETLFGRAGRLFRACEFDKAAGIYESLVAEFPEEAEAYWGLVLCKYGIEYVDDPATGRKVPTCHRSSFDSVMDDSNFEQAEENADVVARKLYRTEAKEIEELRKGIIEVSNKEEPYDIFICYKETDENGERTLDSVMAQDVYDLLTEKGYRVFFSRITLEERLGQEYEPYIFAALNSAKIMLVFGTDYEYFNAVWVKNEWSRFLSLIAAGEKKTLIPCFKGIDAYDMPKEFARLQAQDLGKVGAVQDLLRGIEKLTGHKQQAESVKETAIVQERIGGRNDSLLKRGYMALEDQEWRQADNFFEQALNLDAECGEAYFGKVLAASECCSMEEFVSKRKEQVKYVEKESLAACPQDEERISAAVETYQILGYLSGDKIREEFDNFNLCYDSSAAGLRKLMEQEKSFFEQDRVLSRAARYASGEFEKRLKEAEKEIYGYLQGSIADAEAEDTANVKRITEAYAVHLEGAQKEAESLYESAQRIREADYIRNCAEQEKARTEKELLAVEKKFRYLSDYKDSQEHAEQCLKQFEEIRAGIRRKEEEAENRKKAREKKINLWTIRAIFIFLAGLLVCALTVGLVIPSRDYKKAEALLAESDYASALKGFQDLGDYKDAKDRTYEIRYAMAEGLLEEGKYADAISEFESLGDYEDAANRIHEARCAIADGLMAEGHYEDAIKELLTQIHYKGVSDLILEVRYAWAEALANEENSKSAAVMFKLLGNYKDAAERSRELTDGAIIQGANIIDCGWNYAVGLKSDGSVVAVGENEHGECDVSGWTDIVEISVGVEHTVGLRSDGTVVATGDNAWGQCDVYEWEDIIAVEAGSSGDNTLGLKSDGTVVMTNQDWADILDVGNWTDIIDVSTGDSHVVGLKSDGTVVATGDNTWGQCEVSDWTDIVEVTAGDFCSIGLRSDGTVVMAGDDWEGALDTSAWTDIVAVEMGDGILGLKSDGTVITTGGQTGVTDWNGIVEIASGGGQSIGLRLDGTVVATGNGYYGEFDVSDWMDIMEPWMNAR